MSEPKTITDVKKQWKDFGKIRMEHRSCIKEIVGNDYLVLPCVECGQKFAVNKHSCIGQGIFNLFCDNECEDRYAWKQ